MATEIDKTIEELEAEVLAELEEANGADAPKKSAVKAEPMDKIKPALSGEDKPEDLGKAVTDPKDATDPGKEASKKSKEVSGDAQQKGEGKPDAMQKIKEEDEEDKEDEKSDKEDDKEDEKSEEKDEDEEQKEMSHDDMKKEMLKAMKSMKKDEMANMYASYHSAAMSKTKDEMYKEMMHGMDKMKKEGMKKLHAEMMPSKMKKEEATDAKTEERLNSVDVKEHVDALLNADDSLSKEFKEKAATIFETAVKSKIREEIKRLEEEYQEDVRTEIAETRESLTNKVDSYLDYVTGEWMKENELAIERGLKGEIAEDFISGLKQLFEDHYIDVPAEKYDVLEAQANKISKLEKKLEETIQQVVEAKKSEGALMKESVKAEVSSDLTETEIEKFDSLAQEVEYTDKESYTEKLKTIKENYFPKKQVMSETAHDEVETGTAVQADIDGPMDRYISAIGKAVKSAN
tara:strand:+ start:494 stop:1876 length:1383 start_codon:yes stop_codon:yes gene_type:complete